MSNTNAIIAKALESRSYSSHRRDIAKGLNKHTETYAYTHIIPLVDEKNNEDISLRIAGLVASHDFPQNDKVTFGEFIRRNSDTSLEQNLLVLTKLSQAQAIDSIHRILVRLAKEGKSGFNWFGLGNDIFFWGNGVTDSSLEVRQRILRDFYRTVEKVEGESVKKNSDESVSANE